MTILARGNTAIYLILVTGTLGRIIANLLQDSTGSHASHYGVNGLLRFREIGFIPGRGI